MGNKYDLIVGVVGFVAGALAIGYAVGQRQKFDKIAKKLDKTIDELAETVDVDIPNEIIQKAVKRAVDKEASYRVSEASAKAVKEITSDISKQVSDAVESAHDDIQKEVKDSIQRQVSDLNIESLKREVVKEAKEAAAEKLDGSLNDILESFNRNLTNLSSVYQSMAETMRGSSKEVKLSLG